jgi:MoaA/NifB/PqqE/SkfB family radical SAM enzyme
MSVSSFVGRLVSLRKPGSPRPVAPTERGFWSSVPRLRNLDVRKLLTPERRPRPLYLKVDTVNKCNNDCLICAYSKQGRPKLAMPFDLFEKVLDDYAAIGGGFLSLTPVVGDFLLDSDPLRRIAVAAAHPAVTGIGITTNAAMAHRFSDAELAELLSRVSIVSISIYGADAQEYELMTRKKTFHHMMAGIERIVRFSSCRVLMEFRLLRDVGAFDPGAWLDDNIFAKLGDEAEACRGRVEVKNCINRFANWGIFTPERNPLPMAAEWYDSPKSHKQCGMPVLAVAVLSNGNVSICPCDNYNDVEELRLGNAREMSLADMLGSEKFRRFWHWDEYGVPEFCKTCTFKLPMATFTQSVLDSPEELVGAG